MQLNGDKIFLVIEFNDIIKLFVMILNPYLRVTGQTDLLHFFSLCFPVFGLRRFGTFQLPRQAGTDIVGRLEFPDSRHVTGRTGGCPIMPGVPRPGGNTHIPLSIFRRVNNPVLGLQIDL